MSAPTPAKSVPAKNAAKSSQSTDTVKDSAITTPVTPDTKSTKENTVTFEGKDIPESDIPDDSPLAESLPKKRIPDALSANPILEDFCRQYLSVVDEIAKYNKDVLSSSTSEWTSTKVLEKARELGRPTDASKKPNDEIKSALKSWEDAVNAMNIARRSVIELTSKELGISLSATSERNPEIEAPMKERRKFANEVGTQLGAIAKMTTNEAASDAVIAFLAANPLPAVGRDQVRTFGEAEKATPKYRVTIVVTDKDGKEVLREDGFTKTALSLVKFYDRGAAPKSSVLREVWEKAGNTSDNTPTPTVEFDDNDLHFVITKK